MRSWWVALVGVVVHGGLPSTAAAAPMPSPVPGSPPAPRCHVVPDPHASSGPPGSVVLVIPRVVCTPRQHEPSPRPVRGEAGGGASDGTAGGAMPFTGGDLGRWAALGAGGLLVGAILVRAGRRRRSS